MAGKGDKLRPVDLKTYLKNYDAIDWGYVWCEKCKMHHKSQIKCKGVEYTDE